MFRKLRNRFLVLNLVTISVMMVIAFISIYLITYRDVRSGIDMELRKIQESYNDRSIPLRPMDPNIPLPARESGIKPFRNRSVSFSIATDAQWNITDKSTSFETNDDLYETAKAEAVSQSKDRGDFNLDGEHWTFIINRTPDGYRLVFLDTTSRQAILTNLIYTFLLVAFFMFIIIFFISRFFANRAIKPVKEAFDRQKEFIADASHELKTPLAVINTNVDVLLSNSQDTIDNQAKWLNYIKSQAERMTKLTNDLLYLAKMDHSEIELAYSKFNLSEALENVILTMEAVIYEHNISLDYEIEPKLTAYGNDEQFKQVVMILLDNAVKYTNSNGFITVKLARQNNDLMLSVKNSGEGIAEEHLKKIFDRFYRIDKSRSTKLGGHGLGLSIAKAIIDQHKGKIYAESRQNESTTFIVKLPAI